MRRRRGSGLDKLEPGSSEMRMRSSALPKRSVVATVFAVASSCGQVISSWFKCFSPSGVIERNGTRAQRT